MRRQLSLILIFCLLTGLFLCSCSIQPGEKREGQAETGSSLDTAAQKPSETKLQTGTARGRARKTEKKTGRESPEKNGEDDPAEIKAGENDPERVAGYLRRYGRLPEGYVSKQEAQEAGWEPAAGNLRLVLPDATIGGDYFGNFEGLLPRAKGRKYREADVNYDGGMRGPERLIYSNDGLIFYTDDHYNSFYDVTESWPGTPLR